VVRGANPGGKGRGKDWLSLSRKKGDIFQKQRHGKKEGKKLVVSTSVVKRKGDPSFDTLGRRKKKSLRKREGSAIPSAAPKIKEKKKKKRGGGGGLASAYLSQKKKGVEPAEKHPKSGSSCG